MTFRSILRSALVALGVAALAPLGAGGATAAVTSCEPFPDVSLWGDLTHDSVVRYVDGRLGGDWTTFVDRLERYQAKVREAHDRGGNIQVSDKGSKVSLNGHRLAVFLKASEWRLEVVKCLARERSSDRMSVQALQDFATAAGIAESSTAAQAASESKPNLTITSGGISDTAAAARAAVGSTRLNTLSMALPDVQRSRINESAMDMRVESQCSSGVAVFRLTNVGGRWPDTGRVALYNLDGPEPVQVSSREFRFAEGQMSTFKVRTDRVGGKRFGLWVDPFWAQRAKDWDATVVCE